MCNNKKREVINPSEFGTFGLEGSHTHIYLYKYKRREHVDL